MSDFFDAKHILNSLIEFYKFRNNAEFAKFLGITPQALSNWYSRNSIDFRLLYTKCLDINGEWILSGKGEMLKSGLKKSVAITQDPTFERLYEKSLSTITDLNREIGKLQLQLDQCTKKAATYASLSGTATLHKT